MKIALISASILISMPLLAAQDGFSVSDSINAFSINLLGATNNLAQDSMNIALSPYTVWTLMAIISEGALENTARQIETVLKIPSNKIPLRQEFKKFAFILQQKSDGALLEYSNGIFTNRFFPIKDQYLSVVKETYDVNLTPVNFKDSKDAANVINKYVARATKNRITEFVSSDDVADSQIFLASVLYFKGQWSMPFNRSETHRDIFYDEKNNKLGEVDMMFHVAVFPYAKIEEIRSHVVELPYGNDRKMSMIVVLPLKGESILNVLNLMSKMPFKTIIETLENAEKEFIDDEVHVYLPKFSVSSDFNLNIVLDKMGIKDVFDAQKANLLGIFPHYLYLSRLIQKADIDVDEEGTVAAAVAGASISYKTPPPVFRANKPFIYFIVDKISRSVLFAGKISNPNTLRKKS